MIRRLAAAVLAIATAACDRAPSLPPPGPLPPGAFAFGAFGDGPYRVWEEGRYRRLLADADRADLRFFLHVGDLFWYPCSDDHLAGRLAGLDRLRHPVLYTPGDNEWADCHADVAGRYLPLDRLARIRATFFAPPDSSRGARRIAVTPQSADPAFAEFVENARWITGGVVFATVHMVGSSNAGDPFTGRTAADDSARARRMTAALAWLDAAFAAARAGSAPAVVIAFHGDPGFYAGSGQSPGYAAFVDTLTRRAAAYPGQVLLIHGDSHLQRVDHPLRRPGTADTLGNVTRLEVFGSPDIGWVRVVVDSASGRFTVFEPRRMTGRWF